MPNPLTTPDQLCSQFKKNGQRCAAPKLAGRDVCLFHAPERIDLGKHPAQLQPSIPIALLAKLDLTLPESMSTLRCALFEHVLAGNLLPNQAAQALRFAEAEYEAAPKRKDSALADVTKALLDQKPKGLQDD